MPLIYRTAASASAVRSSANLLRASAPRVTPPTSSNSTLSTKTSATSYDSAVQKSARPFSSTIAQRSGGESEHHESHFDPPGGWLWGIPPGQKAEKEGWETPFIWGFYGSLGLAVVAYAFKPDTSIETWALEEAKRRLQAEGTLPEDK